MPRRFQRPYPPEFRREAVGLVRATGRSVREVAGELGVSYESLRIWLRQDQLEARTPSSTSWDSTRTRARKGNPGRIIMRTGEQQGYDGEFPEFTDASHSSASGT
jgi:transposase